MVLESIRGILESCSTDEPMLSPTILYNEGWFLRLVLDWFSSQAVPDHELGFRDGARWFSEALLPSAFLATPLAEGWTHADGAIGHFDVGVVGKGDLVLRTGAEQLVIVESKMSGGLSAGVTNARYYDQAARTLGCMAEVLNRAARPAAEMSRLGFYVLAPQEQVGRGVFKEQVSKDSIGTKVKQRVDEWVEKHDDDKEEWHSHWFQPALDKLQLDVLSWEGVLATISEHDAEAGAALGAFYDRCLELN